MLGLDLRVRGRLFAGFFAIILLLLIAIIIVLCKIVFAETLAERVIQTELPAYNAFLDLNGQIYQSQASLNNYLLAHDEKYKDDFSRAWQNINRVQLALDVFSPAWTSDSQAKWIEAKSLLGQLKAIESQLINSKNGLNTLKEISAELIPLKSKLLDILDGKLALSGDRVGGLYDMQYDLLSSGAEEVVNDINTVKIVEYMLLVIGIIFSIVITLLTAHQILYPLNSAIDIAKQIASGERNIPITVTKKDEFGELLTALNKMQIAIRENEEKLKKNEARTRELFEEIVQTANLFSRHSSKVAGGDLTQRLAIDKEDQMSKLGKDLNTMTESLATMTKQITEACQNMVSTIEEVKHAIDVQATGASEQASSINQITASLEEIEKSAVQTMDKAKTLGEMAEHTHEKGMMGLQAVEQSVSGMKGVREKVQTIAQSILDLSNQTQQVGEITAVVNNLAQQSKMLALNASIEAAKAGEAGKGFAVVAAEVKNLAEQSEQSTAQVQKILEDIRHATEKAVMATEEGTKGVDHGTTLVEQTGEIVRSLSEVIHETTIATQQIEASIHQETIGIEQITAGMNEIHQVTASFVDSVKQTTEAIGNLASIANILKKYIDMYKL
ncbi:MAG: methyl-accepting chemotaxis protein [Gammaproteobacteria bacterium]|nr:MAG: methyl-accepting chemotaxis protein [Gammaproteobacteria bacterium]